MVGISFNSFLNTKFSKWVIDSGVSQHMNGYESFLHDYVDVSKLNLRASHPIGSSTEINKIRNLQLSNSLTLFDVFGVPGFNINCVKIVNMKWFLMNTIVTFRIHNPRGGWRPVINLDNFIIFISFIYVISPLFLKILVVFLNSHGTTTFVILLIKP